MTVRKLIPLAAAFGLWAGGSAWAEPKATGGKDANQKLADSVATQLKASGVMKGAKVSIETRDGVVDLAGTVASDDQHKAILKSLMTVPGVKRIESGLTVDAPVAAMPALMPEMPVSPMGPMSMPVKRVMSQEPVSALPPGAIADPVPLNGQVAVAPVDPAGPNLPPYAWPTYAPHNNYSRVAYPASYPYNAFPYIGPFYPFPKVPLGWRKVVLEWDDGHWYMGRAQSPHDYWRVRFW